METRQLFKFFHLVSRIFRVIASGATRIYMNSPSDSTTFPVVETVNENISLRHDIEDIQAGQQEEPHKRKKRSARKKNVDDSVNTQTGTENALSANRGAAAKKNSDALAGDAIPNKSSRTRRVRSAPKKSRPSENSQSSDEMPISQDVQPMPESPVEAGIAPDQDNLPGNGSQKGKRGKRGGKRKAHKTEAAIEAREPVDPLATALALRRIPALPPAPENAEKETPEKPVKKISKKEEIPSAQKAAKKRMFISVIPGEQIEVGLAEDGVLLEYYLDMLHHRKLKGNIYKGVIHNIDTNLQAAFIDFGVGKNGFLQIDEVHPEYWQDMHGENGENKRFPPIQKVLRPGQEVLVQVVKEPSGNKGAFLTTWLSLAGRFLVLTPGQEQIGVSRKVVDPEERTRLREMMNGIDPGVGLGVIVRTVGEGATKTTLKNDLQYLKRLWREIRKKATEMRAPAMLYQEPGLSERSVRDYLTDDVSEIWVDNEEEAASVKAMASLLFPRKKNLVHIFNETPQSLWDHFKLRRQLEQIYAREVALPSGGRLVFDQTEALMAIDINSGKISGKGNFETMAFKTNMEASQAIARQLRLRDIGGQVVIDFIEMREKKHVLEVEKSLRQAMKNDRARHDVARMSAFGLLELVRQRMGSSALSISMETCAFCGGTGLRRNLEWQALQTLRDLRQKMQSASGEKYICEYPRELGLYLLNYKRDALRALEQGFNKILEIKIQI